jgi:hypothetical protein
MNRVRVTVLLFAVVTSLLAEAGLASGQPANWVAELPSVDQVKKSTPAGKDERDTTVRQAAALVVWQDVIEAFTKKSFFDFMNANRAAPEVKRYFEYSAASTIDNRQGHAVDAVIAYSDTFPFRQEVLARFLSASSLKAYWDLRRADLTARQARHQAFKTSQATMDQFPTVERVRRDLKGATPRDTAGRTEAALRWLASMAGAISVGRTKSNEYAQARDDILTSNPEDCAEEAGCKTSVESRFYWCRSSYESSPEFVRALADKYLPEALQVQISGAMTSELWSKARALPAQSDFPKPESACTTDGQFDVAAYTAAKDAKALVETALRRRAELIETTHERRKAKAAPYAAARARALQDGSTLKGSLVSVFGVPIGSVLPLPECETLGGYHIEVSGFGARSVVLDDPETKQTCVEISDDGTPSIAWASGGLPSWVSSVKTDIQDDVLVAVKLELESHPRRPPAWIVSNNAAMEMSIAESLYEAGLKQDPVNVATAQKTLRDKYGLPKSHSTKTASANDGSVIEWGWEDHKLHVFYVPGTQIDTIVIELDSVTRARLNEDRKHEATVPQM